MTLTRTARPQRRGDFARRSQLRATSVLAAVALSVEPGGLAIGTVMITSKELDGSETVEVAITSDTKALEDGVDLQPDSVTYDADEDEAVGSATNTSAGTVNSPLMLVLACFTEGGEIIGIVDDVALGEVEIAAGDSTDVAVSPGFYIKECPTYLLAASGTTLG